MGRVIALLTDFGTKDGFIGSVKGVIKSINPCVDIVDITHEITPFDILEASIVLNATYRYFPEKTVFVSVVDPGVGTERNAIVVETEKYIFVAPDNGLLTLPLRRESIRNIIKITNKTYQLKRDNETFHGRDIFAPVATYITKGVPVHDFGVPLEEIKTIPFPEPEKKGNLLLGQIIKFDRFGNGITNIDKLPENIEKIIVNNIPVKKVVKSFLEGEDGALNLVKGSFGFYEIFIPKSNAKERFNLKVGDKVYIYLRA